MFGELVALSLGAIFINNFVFSQFLGICPFIGVSKKLDSVLGMGLAVIFVMTLSSAITYIVYHYMLAPFKLEYLKTVFFILVIASLVQFIEIVMKKQLPFLYNALGIYLPLITTNCAVLGVAIININNQYNFIFSILNSFSAGVGFLLALFLMSVIRERLETTDVPEAFKGVPITMISAGLMALAFLALDKSMLEYLTKK